jgi:hypothetical protein
MQHKICDIFTSCDAFCLGLTRWKLSRNTHRWSLCVRRTRFDVRQPTSSGVSGSTIQKYLPCIMGSRSPTGGGREVIFALKLSPTTWRKVTAPQHILKYNCPYLPYAISVTNFNGPPKCKPTHIQKLLSRCRCVRNISMCIKIAVVLGGIRVRKRWLQVVLILPVGGSVSSSLSVITYWYFHENCLIRRVSCNLYVF